MAFSLPKPDIFRMPIRVSLKNNSYKKTHFFVDKIREKQVTQKLFNVSIQFQFLASKTYKHLKLQ